MKTVSDLFIRNIPEIQEREFKYRTQMSSNELNKLQDESFKDILDLFNKANLLQKELYEFNETNGIESSVYNKRLTDTLSKLYQLQELYNNLKADDNAFRYQTHFAYEAEIPDKDFKSIIDKSTNSITADTVSSTSKTHIYNDTYDEILIPDTIQTYIGPDDFSANDNIYSIEDNDIHNIFDMTDSNVWYRKIVTSNEVNYIENEIVIGLPENIATTRSVNEIIFKPFPVGYQDIMDIQYKTNGSWVRIPGFETYNGTTIEKYHDEFLNEYQRYVILNAGNIKFDFKSVPMNQIKIKLRQRNYDYDPTTNKRTFYLGIRNIDVLFNRYTKDNSVFTQVFELPETERNIKIYDAEVLFNNPNSTGLSFNVTKEYYYYDTSNNYHKVAGSAPLSLNGHKVMVKFFIEGNEETPNIYGTKLKYKLD